MALYLIGLGLCDEKDITLKGLEAVKGCDAIYLESYTSMLRCSVPDMEKLYGKKIIVAQRELVEQRDEILEQAAKRDVALLIIGDIFSATTHLDLVLRAEEKGIKTVVVHNASIMTAIGTVGLDLYKFGRVVSIPFHHQGIASPADAIRKNMSIGLHTLLLLDLAPKENEFLSINTAADYLLAHGFEKSIVAVGCAAVGCEGQEIKACTLEQLKTERFSQVPQCMVLPSRMHFMEEKAIQRWMKKSL